MRIVETIYQKGNLRKYVEKSGSKTRFKEVRGEGILTFG
jgi:hypothetical protein